MKRYPKILSVFLALLMLFSLSAGFSAGARVNPTLLEDAIVLCAVVKNYNTVLSWYGRQSDMTDVAVFRSENDPYNFKQIDLVSGFSSAYTDTNVDNGKTYFYMIQMDENGITYTSNLTAVTIPVKSQKHFPYPGPVFDNPDDRPKDWIHTRPEDDGAGGHHENNSTDDITDDLFPGWKDLTGWNWDGKGWKYVGRL